MDYAERDRIVLANIKLAAWCAQRVWKRYANQKCDLEELVCAANLALVEAAASFDPAAGFKFSSYGSRYIEGKLKGFVDEGRGGRYHNKLVRDGKAAEVVETSLTVTVPRSGEEVERAIPCDRPNAEELMLQEEAKADPDVRKLGIATKAGLTRQEADVLNHRMRGRSLRQIAAAKGISVQRAQQVEAKAKKKVKAVFQPSDLVAGHRPRVPLRVSSSAPLFGALLERALALEEGETLDIPVPDDQAGNPYANKIHALLDTNQRTKDIVWGVKKNYTDGMDVTSITITRLEEKYALPKPVSLPPIVLVPINSKSEPAPAPPKVEPKPEIHEYERRGKEGKWTPLVERLLKLKEKEFIEIPLHETIPASQYANQIRSMLNMRKDAMNTFWSVGKIWDADMNDTGLRITRGAERGPGLWAQNQAAKRAAPVETEPEAPVETKSTPEHVPEVGKKVESTPSAPPVVESASPPTPSLDPPFDASTLNLIPANPKEAEQILNAAEWFGDDTKGEYASGENPKYDVEWEKRMDAQWGLCDAVYTHRRAKGLIEGTISKWLNTEWWFAPGGDHMKPDDDPMTIETLRALGPHLQTMLVGVLAGERKRREDAASKFRDEKRALEAEIRRLKGQK